jgi:hypothetical protein
MLRGAPSELTKYLGNAHGKVKALRQALYFRRKMGSMREKYPEYDQGKVISHSLFSIIIIIISTQSG